MRVLIDMNLSPSWVDVLGEAGHEAIHWSTIGNAASEDAAISAYASAHGYVVLTSDLDFGTILFDHGTRSPSVVQLRVGSLRPTAFVSLVLRALTVAQADIEAGALVTIDQHRARIRILPIERPDP